MVIVAPVSPLMGLPLRNQVYESPPVAVSVVDPPAQIDTLAGEMFPVGAAVTVTVEEFEASALQSP